MVVPVAVASSLAACFFYAIPAEYKAHLALAVATGALLLDRMFTRPFT
jgi:hypothetical protein